MLGVDDRFEYDVLSIQDWFGRRLVTDKMREGRIFLCGDASQSGCPSPAMA